MEPVIAQSDVHHSNLREDYWTQKTLAGPKQTIMLHSHPRKGNFFLDTEAPRHRYIVY